MFSDFIVKQGSVSHLVPWVNLIKRHASYISMNFSVIYSVKGLVYRYEMAYIFIIRRYTSWEQEGNYCLAKKVPSWRKLV